MRFLGLCTCERVIIDKQGAHSLINIMLNAEIQVPAEQIPPNAVSPTQWSVYTAWDPRPEDIGKMFEQVYQIYWPDGEKFLESRLTFTQPNETVQQVTFSVIGFPVGQVGQLRIVTWLDQNGHRVTDLIESHIRVKHMPQQSAVALPSPA